MGRFSTKLKREFKDITGCFFFFVFRLMERGLSVQNFYSVLKPVLFARTRLNTIGRKPKLDRPVPDFLQSLGTTQVARRQRLNMYLNHVIGCFPDRLGGAKWLSGCKLEGQEYLQLARQNGRPVYWLSVILAPLMCWGFGCAPPAGRRRHSRAGDLKTEPGRNNSKTGFLPSRNFCRYFTKISCGKLQSLLLPAIF